MDQLDLMILVVGDHLDHELEKVGRCVYCNNCNKRLYHGELLTTSEREALKTVMAERAEKE